VLVGELPRSKDGETEMGTFSILKEVGYADKLAKFKQETLLAVIAEDTPKRIIEYAGKGICGPLAILWIKAQVLSPHYLPRQTNKNTIKFLDHAVTLAGIEQFLKEQTFDSFEVEKKLLAVMGLRRNNEWFGRCDSILEVLRIALGLLNNKTCVGVLVTLVPKEPDKGTHAVAFARNENRAKFFDSNTGEYLINQDKESEFFNAYLTIYAEHFQTTFTSGIVCGLEIA
jgi:hypothetical protein